MTPLYPTPEHKDASEAIVGLFQNRPFVDTCLLVNSCARDKASKDSCLDIAILIDPEAPETERLGLNEMWEEAYKSSDVFKLLRGAGNYSEVHLDFMDGVFVPEERDEVGGPDAFEMEVGNRITYSVPLDEEGGRYLVLKKEWLHYYSDGLRDKRLQTVIHYCVNDLDHIAGYVNRGLHFQAYQRLQYAFKEFLQALFISHRIYPIA